MKKKKVMVTKTDKMVTLKFDLNKTKDVKQLKKVISQLYKVHEKLDETVMIKTKQKVKLEFDLTDNDIFKEFQRIIKANQFSGALLDIAQEIFRPHRKHGYNGVIQDIINQTPHITRSELHHSPDEDEWAEYNDTTEHPVLLVIEKLEEKFYEILSQRDIELDRDCL